MQLQHGAALPFRCAEGLADLIDLGGRAGSRRMRLPKSAGAPTFVECCSSVYVSAWVGRDRLSRPAPLFIRKKEGSMTNQDDEEKKNMRIMWMASGVIVLFIVGLMGLSMLGMLGNPGTGPTDMSSRSRRGPAK